MIDSIKVLKNISSQFKNKKIIRKIKQLLSACYLQFVMG